MSALRGLALDEQPADADGGERILIVSGGRGAGKTSFCLALAQAAQGAGMAVAGLVSPAVFVAARKVAIDLHDLASGEQRRLALRARADAPGTEGLGWRFEANGLAWGNRLLRAWQGSDLFVIDELGPLEFLGRGGLSEGFAALARGRFRIAVVVVRPELLGAALARWPGASVIEPPAVLGGARPYRADRPAQGEPPA